MDHNAFFKCLKQDTLPACFLFEGEEEYVKHEAWRQLREKLLPAGMEELNHTVLNNSDADTLINACETMPMMCDKRLVTVREYAPLSPAAKNADPETKAKSGDTDAVIEYLGRLPDSVCLVFYVKGKADERRALFKAVQKQHTVVSFARLGEVECVRWLCSNAKKAERVMSQSTASYMIFTVGSDVSALRQELNKLCGLTEAGDEITPEHINAICTKSTECTVFQMVDAQVDGKTEAAFRLLSNLLYSGEDRMMVLAMLLRQYRLLYHMRRLMDERAPVNTQAQLLGIAPFAADRTRRQAAKFSAERLKQAYDYLLNMDYRIKQGELTQTACAENAMLALEKILRGESI